MQSNAERVLKLALLGLGITLCHGSQAQWIAYNDHAAGAGTNPNATRYHILGDGDGTNGALKNIFTGQPVPATIGLSRSGIVLGETAGDNPQPGTPLHGLFDDYVDFAGTPTANVQLSSIGKVTYTIGGLNPNEHHLLHGSAVRGGDASFSNRWTLCELVGADSFLNNHSSGVLTSTQVPQLLPNQAVLNTGINNTADTGDAIGWVNIVPGDDGIIQVVCSKYSGTVPGGSAAGSSGYALTGLKIGELHNDAPPFILEQPTDRIVVAGQPATFSVTSAAIDDAYQWSRNGDPISGATNRQYTLADSVLSDSGSRFTVVVSNPRGSLSSDEAVFIVNPPAWTPIAFDHVWRYDASGTDLGTAWRQNDYDDATWLEGPGALGFETSPLAEPIRTPLSSHNKITYYFRTPFVVTNPPNEHTFHVDHLLDDGAVFYLNGKEWFRSGMPEGDIDWLTPSVDLIGDAGLRDLMLPEQSLYVGTNWVAVEVHQQASSSSDMVFGASITAIPVTPTPLSITNQPVDVEVAEYQAAQFSVGVSGHTAIYQWFKDDIAIIGATSSEHTLPLVRESDAGNYTVTVSNAWSFLQSQTATLIVSNAQPVQILDQSRDQTVQFANELTFYATLGGDQPYYIQWFKDGAPLVGATELSVTINQAHFADAGEYSFVASNNFSVVESTPFQVDILGYPRGEHGTPSKEFLINMVPTGPSIRSIARQRDGRILISGDFESINGIPQAVMARILENGAIDVSFRPSFLSTSQQVTCIVAEEDGNLLIGGVFTLINEIPRNSVARLYPDGSLDLEFTPQPDISSRIWDIALQDDGKVVAVGEVVASGTLHGGVLFRFNLDGSLDHSHINIQPTQGTGWHYYAVAIQPDGRILLGGRFETYNEMDYANLVRLHPDGSLDETFLSGTNAPNGSVHSVQVYRGKILVTGSFTSMAGLIRTGVARLEMDGQIDPTFLPPIIEDSLGSAIVLSGRVQTSGKILIAGNFDTVDDIPSGSVAKLNSNGSLDTSLTLVPPVFFQVRETAIDLNGDLYLVGTGIKKYYGTGEPILDWQRTSEGHLQILWPGERDDLMLESAAGVSGFPWTLVTEPTNKVQLLNATTIEPSNAARVFRLRKL